MSPRPAIIRRGLLSDDEWAFTAPYLIPMREDASRRGYPLREVFNGLRWVIHRLAAGAFEDLIHYLCRLLRTLEGRTPKLTVAILDSRTLQSSLESGARRL